jgi:hypothetical protein
MKMLSQEEFKKAAGTPLFHNRDFSLYDGAPFDCSCGSRHSFNQYGNTQHCASSGAKAKFIVECPQNGNVVTLIETKNKFLIMFDRFVSLAGHVGDTK